VAFKDQVRCPQCGVPNEPGALFCSRCGASQNRPGYSGSRKRRVSLAGFVMALAMLLALGITVFVLYTIINRSITPTTGTTTDPYAGVSGTVATLETSTTAGSTTDTSNSTTDTVVGSVLVRPHAATASSSLKATTLTDFRPTNLLDGDPATAWVSDGNGAGQWVRLEFEELIPLVRLEIGNGYQKSPDLFSGYERVKSILLEYSDGATQVVQLLDSQSLQEITPAADQTLWIKFTVLSVYPTFTWQDAALSEIRVYETIQ